MSSSCIPAVRKLDYLRFTLHDLTSPYETMRELGLEFKERGFGLYRYRQSAVSACGTVMVLWDGPVEGMGVHVQVSGEGCRTLEGMEGFPGWREWVKTWIERKAGFSRFDAAVDDVGGHIAFETVTSQVKNRVAVMRATSHKVIEETNRKGTFQTLYVGKRTSQTMMRCYDKGMQLGEGARYRASLRLSGLGPGSRHGSDVHRVQGRNPHNERPNPATSGRMVGATDRREQA